MPARAAKALVFAIALLPVAMLVRGFLTENLGVNPAETIQLQTGRWALKFLLISLAVTPVRRLTGWNAVIQYRRMLGLFAFFYAVLHFVSYWAFDLGFAFGAMIGDILKRPFIALGFTAFLLLVPLALTSTKGWIRRLGRKWALLHRLVYVAAICAVIHFAWKVKVFTGDPVLYAVILTLLLGFRLAWNVWKGQGRGASEHRERASGAERAPKRRASDAVGESEGRRPDQRERAQRASHANGAGHGAPASERVGESEGRRPSD